MAFSVGSKVQWTSQSQGYEKTKRGVVVAVVPSGERPEAHLPEGMQPISGGGYGFPRDHVSYLIQVGKSSRAYWPQVHRLTKDK